MSNAVSLLCKSSAYSASLRYLLSFLDSKRADAESAKMK
jgi:hypothetical protein